MCKSDFDILKENYLESQDLTKKKKISLQTFFDMV